MLFAVVAMECTRLAAAGWPWFLMHSSQLGKRNPAGLGGAERHACRQRPPQGRYTTNVTCATGDASATRENIHVFLRLAQLTADWELREFVAATLRVGPISASSGAQALAVADVRCRAFSGRLSVNDLIARRFELREAVRARLEKGAACLVATLEGPYPASLLARLEAEGLGGGAAGGTLIVGAVDVSTHEFALAPAFQKAFPRASYISDMAVTPACARLGIGARLLEAALALARQEGGEVFLHVEQDNAAALSLYQRKGFVNEAETAATRALFYALRLHEESRHNLLLRLHPDPSS